MGISISSILILFSLIAAVLVLLGSIKLITVKNIPGSWLIFASIVGYVLTVFLPEAESESGEVSLLWLAVEVGANSFLMVMAAFGFFRLANYVAKNSANKSAQSDA